MSGDLLPRFCGTNEGRYSIGSPWVWRGHAYATDGRIIARVPMPGTPYTVGRTLPEVASLWSNWGEPVEPLPEMTGHVETLTEDCECEWVKCWRCSGHGCLECSGGMRPDRWCQQCHGAGEYRYTRPAPQPVLAGWMAGGYSALLHDLPAPVLVGFKPVPTPTTYERRTQGGIYSWRSGGGIEGLVGCIRITQAEADMWTRVVDAQSDTAVAENESATGRAHERHIRSGRGG
jgi:hypothetical protein